MYVKRRIFRMLLILKVVLLAMISVVCTIDPDDYEDLIVGGNTTDISRFKFIVCLVVLAWYDNTSGPDRLLCGGSIIRRHWVLTAAHCLSHADLAIRKKGLVVRGNTSYCTTRENSIDHVIEKLKRHEQFDWDTADYDIALLKVREPFVGANENVVKLAPSSYQYVVGEIAYVMGWGSTKGKLKLSNRLENQLRYVDVKIFGLEECRKMWNSVPSSFKVHPRNVCAGWKRGGKDSCGGDSGGPLVDKDRLLIGIVSWGSGDCGDGLPGIYVKVSLFNKWANDEVEKERRLHQYL